jgi:hypothetical protein
MSSKGRLLSAKLVVGASSTISPEKWAKLTWDTYPVGKEWYCGPLGLLSLHLASQVNQKEVNREVTEVTTPK